MPRSLFLTLNGLSKFLEVHFKFSSQPDWPILTMAFLTGQPWHMLKSWYTVGAGAQMDLTRGLVLLVA